MDLDFLDCFGREKSPPSNQRNMIIHYRIGCTVPTFMVNAAKHMDTCKGSYSVTNFCLPFSKGLLLKVRTFLPLRVDLEKGFVVQASKQEVTRVVSL